jgi:hypothetical protein
MIFYYVSIHVSNITQIVENVILLSSRRLKVSCLLADAVTATGSVLLTALHHLVLFVGSLADFLACMFVVYVVVDYVSQCGGSKLSLPDKNTLYEWKEQIENIINTYRRRRR